MPTNQPIESSALKDIVEQLGKECENILEERERALGTVSK